MSPKMKCIIVLYVAFAAFSASYAADEVTCTRNLPVNYVPGEDVTVTLTIDVDESIELDAFGIEEFYPSGWTFVEVIAGPPPQQNFPDEHKLSWLFINLGPPYPDLVKDTTITYIVRPPAEETGTKTFTGEVSYFYPPGTPNVYPISGDTEIDPPLPEIPTVGFSLASSSNPEATSPVTLAVALSNAYSETVQVNYSVSGGTATQGEDYTLDSGILTFSIGNTAPDSDIEITVVSDSLYEADETIIVTLSNPANATLGTNPHTYTIENDDPPPSIEFNVADSSGFEDNSPAELTVNISAESGLLAKVDYSVTPGTASSGQDYTPVSGTLTFPAESTAPQTISIPIIDDELDEEDYETVIVTLSNSFNATLGTKTSHTYTILDNDPPPSVSFTSAGSQGKENIVSQVTMVVNLSEESGRTVTVYYSVSGDADVDVDYTIPASPLIFAPGEITKNIILSILNDSDGELDEEIKVTLIEADNAGPGGILDYTYTIQNDDQSSVEFTTASSSGPESDSQVNLTVTLLPEFQELVTVNYSVTGGTATGGGEDYTLESGTLAFVPGDTEENIEITITDDAIGEPDETIIVTLSEPSAGATIGTKDSHTYTIINDDDEIDPNTYGHIPEPYSSQVPRDTIIQLHITDEMIAVTSGVDANTVMIQVEDDVIYDGDDAEPNGTYISDLGVCRRVGTEADYMFVFQPSTLFDYEQKVDVTVNAEDKAGNEMPEEKETYHFYTVMRSFGKNFKVNSDTGTLIQNHPATAMDSEDNIWVVWDETTAAGDTDIYIGVLRADGSTFEESVLVIGDPNNQLNPAIAIDRDNMIYVAWGGDDPNGYWDIFASTSTDGTDWSDPVKVNNGDPNNVSDQTAPAIAIDGNNKAYVTWEDNSTGNKDIWVATSTDVTTWSNKQITTDANDQSEPSIGIDLFDSTAYIAWTDARNAGSTDIYGAESASPHTTWNEISLVKTDSNQSSPVGAICDDGVIHLLWVDDADPNGSIFYGNDESGLPFTTGTSIVDEPNYAQSQPAIAVKGTGETAKVFACWQDGRYINYGDDALIYFAESGSSFGKNIRVVDDEGMGNTQTAPVIGIDKDGNPYIVWVDNRQGNNDIYGAGTTSIGETLQSKTVTASDPNTQVVQINEDSDGVDDVNDVTIEIPAGALPVDTTVTIAELVNPPELPPGGFGVCYEFGPSGLEFDEDKPVTITIPHAAADCPGHSVYNVYWYDPSILPPAPPWTQDGITDVEHLTSLEDPDIPSDVHVIRFKTKHFTGFGPGGGDGGDGGGPGGPGGGGGCDISPAGQGNVIEYMLPYVFLSGVWVIIKRKDARNRRTL